MAASGTQDSETQPNLPRHDLVSMWYTLRNTYNSRALKLKKSNIPSCQTCSSLYNRPRHRQGKGTRFYRNKDGFYIAECGGRPGEEFVSCPGLRIEPGTYIDSVTIQQELQTTKHDLLRELKHIRDRVFATEMITKDDNDEFNALTREYTGIRRMEEAHDELVKSSSYLGGTYSVEEFGGAGSSEDIVMPSLRMKTSKILTLQGDNIVPFETGSMVLHVLCKEDLPIKM